MPASSINDDKQYNALRRDGASKENAARISNDSANTSGTQTGGKGGRLGSYDDWTKKDLLDRAREIGIDDRSKISKEQLVDALGKQQATAGTGLAAGGPRNRGPPAVGSDQAAPPGDRTRPSSTGPRRFAPSGRTADAGEDE